MTVDDRDPRITTWLREQAPQQAPLGLADRVAYATAAAAPRATGSLWRSWIGPVAAVAGAVLVASVFVSVVAPFRAGVAESPSASAPEPVPSMDPSDSAVTQTPRPTATPPSEPPSTGAWDVAAMPDLYEDEHQGEHVRDVTVGGPGFVAVGASGPSGAGPDGDHDHAPVVWTSIDGNSWEPVPGLASLGRASFHAVAAGPDGTLLVLGMDHTLYGRDDEPRNDLGMWSSTDGWNWAAIPAPPNQWLVDVVATETGWLVLGAADDTPDGVLTVWRSDDLITWDAEPLLGDGRLQSPHSSLVLGPGGRAMVTGCGPYPIPDDNGYSPMQAGCDAVIWIEAGDGWELVELPFAFPSRGAGNDERFVIIGTDADGVAAWTSPDGRTWERGPTWNTELPPDVLAATAGGFAAGGTVEADGQWWPAIWRSTDGLSWTDAELLPVAVRPHETAVETVIDLPGGLLAMGYAWEDWPVAYRWTFR